MDRITAAKVFITIVQRGSLSAAADTLDISRAMVTRYLSQMESWAGARLLHRSTRRLSLTPAGEHALARCQQMMALAAEIELSNQPEGEALSGLLRVSCSLSLGQSVLMVALTAFQQRYPLVRIDLHISNQRVNLVEERIDLALRITAQLEPNLIARPLHRCRSVICAAPAYLARAGIPVVPQDLVHHNCLAYSHFGKSLWHFTRRQEKEAVAVSGNLSGNDSVMLLAATLAGAGIAMQPVYSAQPFLARGELVALLPDYQLDELGVYAIYASRQYQSARLRALLDFLVEWFGSEDAGQLLSGTAL
ncbi:LysR family transcriptional regulator [Erwinia persicina]|uniref:LysR family transcriptional regulator n=1 Tax=Erwinia persicina TaxID=55211 RepID=A0A4U3FFQ9_9GAMM|nr:LysR family transcriptional regulator [Erwinia persicina]MBD8106981.1 LysR family transcriptional regulator [Erwinia persicina]MBD8210061.1 LysR family transcriptional regulator [Erwinia persicina]MCQ4095475.1 LysR family transcriptional regulator [Erwinia persicina]MCQ4099895.1 LysR family transcriptional regulator [Erwinia persicina]QZQ51050.1 LysR family transcriptional regulator [Erwinia persicina]